MKELFAGVFGLGLLAILVGGIVYFWLEIWHIFGWVLVYTFVVSFLVAIPVLMVSKSRVIDDAEDSITYNPKEWPLYLNILFGLGIIGYLYQYMVALPDLSDGDYKWGVAYLGFNVFSIVLMSLKYFANKDDEIVLTPEGIKVLDMEKGKDEGFTLPWGDVSEVKRELLSSEIVLTVGTEKEKDSMESYSIKLNQMNMQGQKNIVLTDIQAYLSRYGAQIDESSSNLGVDTLREEDTSEPNASEDI